VFASLPAHASYTLTASKFGYLDGGYGRDTGPTDPPRAVHLLDGQWVSGLRVSIWKPAVISGVVRDETGEPVVGVFVRALVRIRIHGRSDFAAGPLTATDDRGEYRISGLGPGEYLVQVPSVQASVPPGTKVLIGTGANQPEGIIDIDDTHRLAVGRYPLPPPRQAGRPQAYPLMFHPSSMSVADAETIALKYGESREAVDLTLRPVAAVRVSGVIEGPQEALNGMTIRLLPAGFENLGVGSEAATSLVSADGRFTFFNVPAGSYTIDAPTRISEFSTQQFRLSSGPGSNFPPPPPSQGFSRNSDFIDAIPGMTFSTTSYRGGTPAEYSARVPVTIGDADIDNLVVRLRPHATMSGRIAIDMDPAKPDAKPPSFNSMSLDPASGEAYLGRPQRRLLNQSPAQAADTFTIPGIIPGKYFLRLQGASGFMIKSISWKGVDHADAPFDAASAADMSDIVVTITNATPALAGTVRGADGAPADSAMVIAFPTDQNAWRNVGLWPRRLKSAPVSSAGGYRFTTLPAGEYFVAAVGRQHLARWQDPAFLAQVARSAARVRLNWGAESAMDLSVVVIK
jgi:hypothetical protein